MLFGVTFLIGFILAILGFKFERNGAKYEEEDEEDDLGLGRSSSAHDSDYDPHTDSVITSSTYSGTTGNIYSSSSSRHH